MTAGHPYGVLAVRQRARRTAPKGQKNGAADRGLTSVSLSDTFNVYEGLSWESLRQNDLANGLAVN